MVEIELSQSSKRRTNIVRDVFPEIFRAVILMKHRERGIGGLRQLDTGMLEDSVEVEPASFGVARGAHNGRHIHVVLRPRLGGCKSFG